MTAINTHYGQWTFDLSSPHTFEIFNGTFYQGHQAFFKIVMGQYGPIIIPEPEFAFECPAVLTYQDAAGGEVDPKAYCAPVLRDEDDNLYDHEQRISGIICKDENWGTVHRFSLTNAMKKGVMITHNEDGSIEVDGETWYLVGLFSKDKARFANFDAYYSRTQPQHVVCKELEDVQLF